jgi:uncharacterized protein (DUF1015 family)
VARFEPFGGLRYSLDRVPIDQVTAPPYDVVDDDERAVLVARNPQNIVNVDLPRAAQGVDAYARAADILASWQRDGIVVHDDPAFYVYRMDHIDEDGSRHRTTGVIGALELSRPGEGDLLPHEHTTPKAKSDRLQLLRATGVQLSPIWGLSPAAGLSELLDVGHPPLASWVDDDEVTHSFWVVDDDERTHAIADIVASEPIVIADGHHRYETSLAYRDERRERHGSGPYDAVMTYVVELVDDQLAVRPIHRLLEGLPDGFDYAAAFDPFFELTPAGPIDAGIVGRMQRDGVLALVTPTEAFFLRPRTEAFEGTRDLDTVRLDVALATFPPHEVVFQHGVDNVVTRVEKGAAAAGVLLRPATVDQIVDIARGGERMPPKTTFFHPKPRTGVVLRDVH